MLKCDNVDKYIQNYWFCHQLKMQVDRLVLNPSQMVIYNAWYLSQGLKKIQIILSSKMDLLLTYTIVLN